jgi:hypothetical protein
MGAIRGRDKVEQPGGLVPSGTTAVPSAAPAPRRGSSITPSREGEPGGALGAPSVPAEAPLIADEFLVMADRE